MDISIKKNIPWIIHSDFYVLSKLTEVENLIKESTISEKRVRLSDDLLS